MKLKIAVAAALTIVSLYFLATVLFSTWGEVRDAVDMSMFFVFGAFALPAYVATAVVGAVAWTLAFRTADPSMSFVTGLRVHLVSQIGKYVPGNIGHFVGRLGMLKMEGLSVAKGGVSIVLEILWTIGAAAALSVYAMFAGAMAALEASYDVDGWLAVAILVVALLTPNVMIVMSNRLPERVRAKLGFAGKIARPSESVVLGCYALYFLSFLLNGLILLAGFSWLFGAPHGDLPLIVSFYAVAWLLGFVLPGAPGGIGVREAVFVLLFGAVYGAGIAAAMAVVMRVISVLGDLVAFGIGMYLARRHAAL